MKAPTTQELAGRLSSETADLPGDSRLEKPLYEQIARTLQNEITSGVHPVGTQLPTEAVLCRRFSVSRHTVREALRVLREDGLISSRQGAGTVVRLSRRADEFELKTESIDDLVSYAPKISLDLESFETIPISDALAVRTGIPSGERWLVLRGYVTGSGSEIPVCWAEHFVNLEYEAISDRVAMHRGPIFRLIEEAMGVEITEIEQEIRGALISAALAAGLGVEPSSAAIEVKRIYTTREGRVAQVTLHTHPASRFLYKTAMHRPKI